MAGTSGTYPRRQPDACRRSREARGSAFREWLCRTHARDAVRIVADRPCWPETAERSALCGIALYDIAVRGCLFSRTDNGGSVDRGPGDARAFSTPRTPSTA